MRATLIHPRTSLGAVAVALLLGIPALVLAPAAAASKDAAEVLVEHCELHGSLAGFSQGAYAKALHLLEATEQQYSDCEERMRAAQLAAAASHHPPGLAAGGQAGNAAEAAVAPPTPAEQAHLEHLARREPSAPVRVGQAVVDPGVVHVDLASAIRTLPTPLLALLALAAALAIAGGGLAAARWLRRSRPTATTAPRR